MVRTWIHASHPARNPSQSVWWLRSLRVILTRTFAGAVGGSLSVPAAVSAGLAFSIYWRRRSSARRQMRDRERQGAQSFHSDVSGNPPSMHGLSLLVPRYFPGTIPAAPPPYVGPVDGSSVPTPVRFVIY
jgi:hypothetical protein